MPTVLHEESVDYKYVTVAILRVDIFRLAYSNRKIDFFSGGWNVITQFVIWKDDLLAVVEPEP